MNLVYQSFFLFDHDYGKKSQSGGFYLKELTDEVNTAFVTRLAEVSLQERHAESPGQLGQAKTFLSTAWIKPAVGERTG